MALEAAPSAGAGPLPDFVLRRTTGFYRSLNPLTKLAIAALEVVVAFAIPGWLGPVAVLATVGAMGAATRTLRDLALIGLATAPLLVSILVVNLFLLPGAVLVAGIVVWTRRRR